MTPQRQGRSRPRQVVRHCHRAVRCNQFHLLRRLTHANHQQRRARLCARWALAAADSTLSLASSTASSAGRAAERSQLSIAIDAGRRPGCGCVNGLRASDVCWSGPHRAGLCSAGCNVRPAGSHSRHQYRTLTVMLTVLPSRARPSTFCAPPTLPNSPTSSPLQRAVPPLRAGRLRPPFLRRLRGALPRLPHLRRRPAGLGAGCRNARQAPLSMPLGVIVRVLWWTGLGGLRGHTQGLRTACTDAVQAAAWVGASPAERIARQPVLPRHAACGVLLLQAHSLGTRASCHEDPTPPSPA